MPLSPPEWTQRRAMVAYVISWLVIVLFVTLNTVISHRVGGHATPIHIAFARSMGICLYWALAAPLIWRCAQGLAFTRENWASRLAVHLPLAVLFALVHVPFRVALDLLIPIPGRPSSTLGYLFGFYATSLFARGILIYGIFLALTHAVRYYREFLRQAQLTAELQTKVAELLADTEATPSQYSDRFILRESGRIFPVPVRQIDWIEAAGNYVALHINGKTHLLRDSMAAMEQKLDPKVFVRIRRSVIVQIDRIEELKTLPGGRFAALLRGGNQITLGRSGMDRLDNLLEQLTLKQQASASS
jgi:hypothetical protein